MKTLRERHNSKHQKKSNVITNGIVLLIKGDIKNKGKRNIGTVTDLFRRTDREIRAVKLRVGNKTYEKAIQHLYPTQ